MFLCRLMFSAHLGQLILLTLQHLPQQLYFRTTTFELGFRFDQITLYCKHLVFGTIPIHTCFSKLCFTIREAILDRLVLFRDYSYAGVQDFMIT